MEHNIFKNPTQLLVDKPVGYLQASPRIWTRDYREQTQLAVRAGLELGDSGLQVQRFNRSATLLRQSVFPLKAPINGFQCLYKWFIKQLFLEPEWALRRPNGLLTQRPRRREE